MSQYAIAASLVVFAVVAWDVSRRFFALQLRKLTEHEEFATIRDEIVATENVTDKGLVELKQAIAELEETTRKSFVLVKRDVKTLDTNATELDGKMSRLYTQKAPGPRTMTLGGIRR